MYVWCVDQAEPDGSSFGAKPVIWSLLPGPPLIILRPHFVSLPLLFSFASAPPSLDPFKHSVSVPSNTFAAASKRGRIG